MQQLYGHKTDRFVKWLGFWLVLILALKIAGFFTWSENVAITRVFKVISRISMTVAIYWIYEMLRARGNIASFKSTHFFPVFLYFGYLLLGLTSMLWTSDVGVSALQWIMDFESFVFCWYFIRVVLLLDVFHQHQKLYLSKMMAIAIMLIMSIFLIGVLVNPVDFYRLTHGGEEARLGGFFMNPNELGMLACVGISCSYIEIYEKRNRGMHFTFVLLNVVALVLTGSRSSTIGFFLITTYFILQSDNAKMKLLVNMGMFLAIPVVLQTIIFKQGDIEEVMSMTGRLPFWTALLNEGLPKEPLLGFGFMRIAYRDFFQSVHTYAGQMTHNTFIQVLMNLGFVGLTIVLSQVSTTVRAFIKEGDKIRKLTFLGIFIPILINSFTEFGIFGETNFGILFYQILIIYITLEYNFKLDRYNLRTLELKNASIPLKFGEQLKTNAVLNNSLHTTTA